jgi:two-component system response regulator FlrC
MATPVPVPGETLPAAANGSHSASAGPVVPLHEMEKRAIMHALEQTNGNRTQAAELLQISIRTLRNKLAEYRDAGDPIEVLS